MVKLVIDEAESAALERHLESDPVIATSRIAVVEVSRATQVANPSTEVQAEVDRLLASCIQVSITAPLLRAARRLTSPTVRTLDAIHLASALRIDPDEFVAYDERLLAAASAQGLATASPRPGQLS